MTLSSLVTPSTSATDIRAEFAFEFLARKRRVFERVVQDRGDDRFGIHAQIGEDGRDGDRMRDVGFAALARLARVRLRAEQIRFRDPRDLFARQITQPIFESQHVGRESFLQRRVHPVTPRSGRRVDNALP